MIMTRIWLFSSLENALSSANFKLSKIVNDEAILTISTNQIISEPITSMALMAVKHVELERLRQLVRIDRTAVDHRYAEAFEMLQPMQRVKSALGVPT